MVVVVVEVVMVDLQEEVVGVTTVVVGMVAPAVAVTTWEMTNAPFVKFVRRGAIQSTDDGTSLKKIMFLMREQLLQP
jgi:hypothetical protein